MKNTLQIITILITPFAIANTNIELSVSGAQQTKMPIAIIILNEKNNELTAIANTIKNDLEFTDQFQPRITRYNQTLSKKDLRKNIQHLANTGTPLALCIDAQSDKNIDWRLYDTMQCTQLGAKRYKKRGSAIRGWAHAIADEARKTLTGHEGFFSSRIAYCKDGKDTHGKTIRKIYIADFDGSNEELLLDSCGITLAPRWHPRKAELFYSENTSTNIQLKSVNVKKRKKNTDVCSSKKISPFESGVNMLVSFDPIGKNYAFCASRGNGNCQIYLNKDDNVKPCTKNTGNNDSPILIDNERICFCSDFQMGSPQIYIGNLTTGHLQRITHGGYCTSPSYCAKTNKIAYHKMIQGTMQIMEYNCTTKIHTQLTHSSGNKHEASWSPDGTMLSFSHEGPNHTSRIESLNLLTKKTKFLTKASDYCSYPNCGPCYQTFPVVT